jgi:hypothetical protein
MIGSVMHVQRQMQHNGITRLLLRTLMVMQQKQLF